MKAEDIKVGSYIRMIGARGNMSQAGDVFKLYDVNRPQNGVLCTLQKKVSNYGYASSTTGNTVTYAFSFDYIVEAAVLATDYIYKNNLKKVLS